MRPRSRMHASPDETRAMAARLSSRNAARAQLAGPRPTHWEKPLYNSDAYREAVAVGWIQGEEQQRDYALHAERRNRSLSSAHSYRTTPRKYPKPETNQFVPEMSLRVDQDRNLRGSAGKVARFLMKEAYQKARDHRNLRVTVSYIAKGLDLSERHVQRLLRNLEEEGYLDIRVMVSEATGMAKGLLVHLADTLFPRHAAEKWPARREEPGVTFWSDNQDTPISYRLVRRKMWALKCMSGVKRAWAKATNWGTTPLPVFASP